MRTLPMCSRDLKSIRYGSNSMFSKCEAYGLPATKAVGSFLKHVHVLPNKASTVFYNMEIHGKGIYISGFEGGVDCNAAFFSLAHSLKESAYKESNAPCLVPHIHGEKCEIVQERKLFNGDIYVGSWQGGLPEGRGKYLWLDGCMYEGEWVKGKTSGKGRLSWPSGATYEGDFLAGFIHGIGTYTGVDGTTYTGGWFLNEKTGFGTKSYSNGDLYEGSWNKGLPEGVGRYVWKNGDMYVGEWISGMKSGRGTLMWASGGKYTGQWLEGSQHGHGVYAWGDCCKYVGTWSRGLKDGRGTFIPSSTTSLPSILAKQDSDEQKNNSISTFHSARSSSVSDGEQRNSRDSKLSIDGFSAESESSTSSESGLEDSSTFERSWTLDEAFDRFLILDDDAHVVKGQESLCGDNGWAEQETLATTVIERHYVQGVLINELVKENKRLGTVKPQPDMFTRVSCKAGEAIFKGHQSYELMLSLQLGIRYTVGKKNAGSIGDVSEADFGPKARVRMSFPKRGSHLTPPHRSTDFKWKDYCPWVFRHLRELFKIDAADYMLSICGDGGLRELSSPGKSGSVFYLSQDDRFLIKTLRKTEVKVLLGMLRNYCNHVRSNENTLITKFFGLHRIQHASGQKIRFVVMGNMFCTDLRIHQRFDLKGSSQGRSADKLEVDETTTLKDLDLKLVFKLEPSWRQALLRQVESDCKFLESEHIMDYSLLLGLHYRTPQYSTVFSRGSTSTARLAAEAATAPFNREGVRSHFGGTAPARVVNLASHKPKTILVGENTLRAVAGGDADIDLAVPRTARLQMQLGVNLPARADRKPSSKGKASCARSSKQDPVGEAHDVVLYFGIIDILQRYDMGKKLERAYKSLQYDALSISAVDPSLYSKRFQNCIRQTFPGARIH